ncbi:hypothetical protein [Aeromicrobium sp. P5_D10]
MGGPVGPGDLMVEIALDCWTATGGELARSVAELDSSAKLG